MDNADIILHILIFIILIASFIILVQIIGVLLYLIFVSIVIIVGDILISICSPIIKILEKFKEYKENKNNKEKKHMFLPKYWCPHCKEFRTFWKTSSLDNGRRECKCCNSRVEYSVNVLHRFLSEEYVEKKEYYLFNVDIDIRNKLDAIIDSRIEQRESNKKSIVPDDLPLSKKEEDHYYNMVALLSSELPGVGIRDILYYITDTNRFYLYYGNNYFDVTDSLRKWSKQ